MARRQTRAASDEAVEEVFANLDGTADVGKDASDLENFDKVSDSDLGKQVRARMDDDLQVVDEDDQDDTDTGDDDADDQADTGADDEEVVAQPTAATRGEVVFDPKDVQMLGFQAQNLELREANAKEAATRATADLETIKTDLEAAMEAGDTKRTVGLQMKLADAKVAQSNAAGELQNVNSDKAALTRRANEIIARAPKDPATGRPILDKPAYAAAETAAAAQQSKVSKLAPKFMAANKWFTDPKNAGMATTLRGIDQTLAAEGKLDKNTPAYFEELGRRFNNVHPGVYRGFDGKPIATGRRQRNNGRGTAPVPNSGGTSVRDHGNSGREFDPRSVKFTSEDVRLMRQFQMDPDDMEARRQWLSSKREIAANDAARG